MELGVSHVQNLSCSTPIVDNIFDKYNKNLVPIRSLSGHDMYIPLCDDEHQFVQKVHPTHANGHW